MLPSPSRPKRARRQLAVTALAALLCATPIARAAETARPAVSSATTTDVTHHTLRAGGADVFYRAAGPKDAPVVLLLHGFPSSSFMFRELIPKLAARYRVIAPDYPGFGQSSQPPRAEFAYTFEHLAQVLGAFVDALGLTRYALYVQDYGAPLGFRLALAHPERVAALIVQNGNAYESGLARDVWAPLVDLWKAPTPERRELLRRWLSPDGVRQQYVWGVPAEQLPLFSPDTWTLDSARLARPEAVDIQLDLFGDYGSNVALYPRFQELLRRRQPPTLVVWGRFDPFFLPAGAEAYRRDVPRAELVWLDAGHFALETHADEIARHMLRFLATIQR